jgi:hypothetical protein
MSARFWARSTSCSERSTGDRDRSLKRRAGLFVKAAASFLVAIGGLRLASGEPLVRPQNDVGIDPFQ